MGCSSFQVPIVPDTGKIIEGSIKEQTHQVFRNIEAILNEAGYSFKDVVKSTCLLSDIADFKAMNEVYSGYFPDNKPARAAFAVKSLPMGALIEIESIAIK
jgi:2-iminobutanoate/2-iminopropanoate deaminase